jgi:hypothetical protein
MALTGRFDFRRTMTGQLRLWLEYDATGFWDFLTRKKTYCRRWRKANIMNLAAPELRHLMDMRFTNSPEMPRRQNVVRGRTEKVGEEHEAALIKVHKDQPNGEDTKPDQLP